jgi:hypothetical protein
VRPGVVPRPAWLLPGTAVGRQAAMVTIAASPIPLRARNAVRQPACWPSQVPTGRPSTAASELPANTTAITRPRRRGGKSPAAVGTTTDQNSAWLSAVTTRAPSSTQ